MRAATIDSMTAALAFAISFAFADFYFALGETTAWRPAAPGVALSLLGIATIVGLLGYVLAWLFVLGPIRRRYALDPKGLQGAAIAFIVCFVGMAGMLDIERTRPSVELVLLAAVSAAPAVAAYRALASTRRIPAAEAVPAAVLFAVPWLWILLFAYEWSARSHVAVPPMALLGWAVPLVPVAVILWKGIRSPAVELAVLASVALVLSAAVAVVPIAFDAPTAVREADEQTSRPVRRIVLISIDTLRSDSIGPSAPQMAALAADGVHFTNAVSPAPWTTPAMASIVTGLAPAAHTATLYNARLPYDADTLAERLRRRGYATAAVVSNPLVGPLVQLEQGFEDFLHFPKASLGQSIAARLLRSWFPEELRETASTKHVTDLALRWLRENADRDFFLWVHYFDPHEPYSPPADFRPDAEPPAAIGWHVHALGPIRLGIVNPTAEERTWIRELYDAEVRYVDSSIGRLIRALQELGLYEEALVILTSDHGEEFWEHGTVGHGHTLFGELLRVPMIVKLPGAAVRKTVDAPASTVAITPTVLDLAGIPHDPADFSESTLRGFWSVPAATPRAVFSERVNYGLAIQVNGVKLIRDRIAGRDQFFDLAADPEENTALAAPSDELRREFDGLAEHYLTTAEELRTRLAVREEIDSFDDRTLEALRALGYL